MVDQLQLHLLNKINNLPQSSYHLQIELSLYLVL